MILQAIGTPNAIEKIIRSLLFYAITNLEAFTFCFAGEYLNNKVSDYKGDIYNNDEVLIIMDIIRLIILIKEQCKNIILKI